jgi:hypothetical protein
VVRHVLTVALTDHVLSDVVNADRPAWVQMNCTVLT